MPARSAAAAKMAIVPQRRKPTGSAQRNMTMAPKKPKLPAQKEADSDDEEGDPDFEEEEEEGEEEEEEEEWEEEEEDDDDYGSYEGASGKRKKQKTGTGTSIAPRAEKKSQASKSRISKNMDAEAVALREVYPLASSADRDIIKGPGKKDFITKEIPGTMLYYPKWIDNDIVQNESLRRECELRGWTSDIPRDYLAHTRKEEKRIWLRRYCHNNNDKRPGQEHDDDVADSREDRAVGAKNGRAKGGERRQAAGGGRGNSNAVVLRDPNAPPPAAAQGHLQPALDAATATVKEQADEIARMTALLEACKKEKEAAVKDAHESRRLCADAEARVEEWEAGSAKGLDRYMRAVTKVCGPEVRASVLAEHGTLLEAEAKATEPWDKALAHVKHVEACAITTKRAGAMLAEKIEEAVNSRPPTWSAKKSGKAALAIAKMQSNMLAASMDGVGQVVLAVEEAVDNDKKAAKTAAKKEKEAAKAARDTIENAQIDEQFAMEMEAEAEMAAVRGPGPEAQHLCQK